MYLSKAEADLLLKILSRTGFARFPDWCRAALRQWSVRLPESQGKIRVELDPEHDGPTISRAQEVLAKEGWGLKEAWRGEPNPDRREDLRRRAGTYLDDAAHLSSILEKLEERRFVLVAGLKAPRRRHVRSKATSPRRRASQEP